MHALNLLEGNGVPRIGHDEAMAITSVENARFSELINQIADKEWSRPTDCTRWDVRAVVVHVVAGAEAQASMAEFVRQFLAGPKLMKEIDGVYPVDGMNEAALRARRSLENGGLAQRWDETSARALRARRRMPRPIRALPVLRLAPGLWKPLGYLYDMGFTRDVWMHRVDLSRALDRPLHVTSNHDGRIVADIIAEWATTHGDPFDLDLTGPAGGRFARNPDGHAEALELDAVEACRMLSGRGEPAGTLRHPLLL